MKGQLLPGDCCGLVLRKDTTVMVHLQHTPVREESSTSVNASDIMFGRG